MVVLRRDSRSKRAKGRYEKPAPDRKSAQADLVALIRSRRKAAAGSEQRAAGESCLRSSVPGMPAGSEAVDRITWNHFYLGWTFSSSALLTAITRSLCLPL